MAYTWFLSILDLLNIPYTETISIGGWSFSIASLLLLCCFIYFIVICIQIYIGVKYLIKRKGALING